MENSAKIREGRSERRFRRLQFQRMFHDGERSCGVVASPKFYARESHVRRIEEDEGM